jgi:hypothetical protein
LGDFKKDALDAMESMYRLSKANAYHLDYPSRHGNAKNAEKSGKRGMNIIYKVVCFFIGHNILYWWYKPTYKLLWREGYYGHPEGKFELEPNPPCVGVCTRCGKQIRKNLCKK